MLKDIVLMFVRGLLRRLLPRGDRPLPNLFPTMYRGSVLRITLLRIYRVGGQRTPNVRARGRGVPYRLRLKFR